MSVGIVCGVLMIGDEEDDGCCARSALAKETRNEKLDLEIDRLIFVVLDLAKVRDRFLSLMVVLWTATQIGDDGGSSSEEAGQASFGLAVGFGTLSMLMTVS